MRKIRATKLHENRVAFESEDETIVFDLFGPTQMIHEKIHLVPKNKSLIFLGERKQELESIALSILGGESTIEDYNEIFS